MVKIEPSPGRAQVVETVDGVLIRIPSRRHGCAMAFLGFWLLGWAAGEAFAVWAVLNGGTPLGPRLFVLVWLCGWTVGGFFALRAWLWMLVGREMVLVNGAILAIKRDIFGLGRVREYDWSAVANLRAAPPTGDGQKRLGAISLGASEGAIAFDYGARTWRFGSDLDEAEAAQLVALILDRYPPAKPGKESREL